MELSVRVGVGVDVEVLAGSGVAVTVTVGLANGSIGALWSNVAEIVSIGVVAGLPLLFTGTTSTSGVIAVGVAFVMTKTLSFDCGIAELPETLAKKIK